MLPYLDPPPLYVGGLWLRWAFLFAVIGVLTAHFLLLWRAKRLNLDVPTAAAMSFFMVVAGVAGARLFKLAYVPQLWPQITWQTILFSAGGLASFGGLLGGLIGALLYFAARRFPPRKALDYLDALVAVFPMGWIFGRMGCAIVHDHPGLATNSFLAVAYPDLPRYDLGLTEVLFFATVMIPLFVWLGRSPRPRGFFLATFFIIYGAFRLWLDTLHVDPPRFAGVTVDQWAYGGMLIAGALLVVWMRASKREEQS
ncbi:MAG: prolipoprotein diacylglyceryl transferase family protein [Acidobacteriota bacterium]